jgi:hypothetical protein
VHDVQVVSQQFKLTVSPPESAVDFARKLHVRIGHPVKKIYELCNNFNSVSYGQVGERAVIYSQPKLNSNLVG